MSDGGSDDWKNTKPTVSLLLSAVVGAGTMVVSFAGVQYWLDDYIDDRIDRELRYIEWQLEILERQVAELEKGTAVMTVQEIENAD